jgi:hypothetical protein
VRGNVQNEISKTQSTLGFMCEVLTEKQRSHALKRILILDSFNC